MYTKIKHCIQYGRGLPKCCLARIVTVSIPNEATDTTSLTRLFADAVCNTLVSANLLDRKVADTILAQNHTGFSVWVGDEIQATDT